MLLYFAPLACSMATRIYLTEVGLDATFVEVDPITKRTVVEDQDYREIHPLGLVPALRTEDGILLTESAAVLQYVAERAGHMPTDAGEAAQLRRWLSFIGTELHKMVFSFFFNRRAPEAVRQYALDTAGPRFAILQAHLRDREFLLDAFSVADAYLITALNWAQAIPVDLSTWPAVAAYLERGLQRPSVRAAIEIELPLFLEERRRSQAG